MAYARRTTVLAAAACAVASAVVLAAYLAGFASAPRAQGVAAQPQAGMPTAARMPSQPQPVAASRSAPEETVSTCPEQPLLPARNAGDGQFLLQPAADADTRSPAFLAVAREAAQEGRARDAEVALLAACRAAERSAGAPSAPLADAKSQLARYYVAQLALADEDAHLALRQRAATLWEESARAYAATLGRNASKTRMARERLASLQLSLPEPEPPQATARMGAARDLSVGSERQLRPTPSVATLVESDPQLAQLDRDLQRLRAQASRVARDPAGLRRREAQALAQRDARCRDKACLLQWYAQRRRQLLAEF